MLYQNITIFYDFQTLYYCVVKLNTIQVTVVVVVSCCLARAGAGAALIMYSVARRPSQLVQKSRNRAGQRQYLGSEDIVTVECHLSKSKRNATRDQCLCGNMADTLMFLCTLD